MYGIEKPTSYRGAMLVARDVTRVETRTEFEIYLDVARKIVRSELSKILEIVPIDDIYKEQVIEAQAFSRAQAAHLSDNGGRQVRQPVELLSMLERLDDFDPMP